MNHSSRMDRVAVVFAMAFPTAAAWAYFVIFADRAFMPFLYTAAKIVQFSFPALWVIAIRRKRIYRKYPRSAALFPGMLSGLALAVGMGAVYWGFFRGNLPAAAASRMSARVEAFGVTTPFTYLLMAVGFSVVHAFLEEYYWRWFVFGELRGIFGGTVGIALSSIAFMSHHVIVLGVFLGPGAFWTMTPWLSLGVAGAGAFWAWLYHRSGGLAGPWLSHMLMDLAIFTIGYDLIRTIN